MKGAEQMGSRRACSAAYRWGSGSAPYAPRVRTVKRSSWGRRAGGASRREGEERKDRALHREGDGCQWCGDGTRVGGGWGWAPTLPGS